MMPEFRYIIHKLGLQRNLKHLPHLQMVEKTERHNSYSTFKPFPERASKHTYTMLSLAGRHRNPPKDDVSCPDGLVKPVAGSGLKQQSLNALPIFGGDQHWWKRSVILKDFP